MLEKASDLQSGSSLLKKPRNCLGLAAQPRVRVKISFGKGQKLGIWGGEKSKMQEISEQGGGRGVPSAPGRASTQGDIPSQPGTGKRNKKEEKS